MNAFTIVNRRPTFATGIAAGSLRPQQMLPPGSPMLSHVSPVGPEPVRVSSSGRGRSPITKVNPVGPEPVLHLGLPTGSTLHISGPIEAMLPHFVE